MATLLLPLNETQQMIDMGEETPVAPQDFSGIVESDFRSIDKTVRLGQGLNYIGRKIIPFQGHDIDASRPRRCSFDEHIGGDIVQDAAQSANKAVASDRAEMMHAGGARDGNDIVYMNVAS